MEQRGTEWVERHRRTKGFVLFVGMSSVWRGIQKHPVHISALHLTQNMEESKL